MTQPTKTNVTMIDWSAAVLYSYNTGQALRNATEEEREASIEASETDGGAGVITTEVYGIPTDCYVTD